MDEYIQLANDWVVDATSILIHTTQVLLELWSRERRILAESVIHFYSGKIRPSGGPWEASSHIGAHPISRLSK